MNRYNSNKKQEVVIQKRNTNVLQCLSEKRDAVIVFRLPSWMKQEIKASGKSEADFIIAKLGETMKKPVDVDETSWQLECEEMFGQH